LKINKQGDALENLKKKNEAIECFKKAVELNHEKAVERVVEKKTAESFYDEGEKYFDSGDYRKSILFLDNAIRLKKDFAEAYFLKSKCLDRLEEKTVNSQDFVNKANALVNSKKYSEAIEVYLDILFLLFF
jgi:tetratricopeptide (TPR) repeat protein